MSHFPATWLLLDLVSPVSSWSARRLSQWGESGKPPWEDIQEPPAPNQIPRSPQLTSFNTKEQQVTLSKLPSGDDVPHLVPEPGLPAEEAHFQLLDPGSCSLCGLALISFVADNAGNAVNMMSVHSVMALSPAVSDVDTYMHIFVFF